MLGSLAVVAFRCKGWLTGELSVVAYATARRTREIGIRASIGAQPKSILGFILWQSTKLIAIGLLIGFGGSLVLVRLFSSLLFEVTSTHPLTYAGVATLIISVGLAGSYLPARHVMNLDPITALHHE